MSTWRRRIPILGLALVCLTAAAYAVAMPADERQQPLNAAVVDLGTAARIDVSEGATVVLSGQFGAETTDDDEIKREASLAASSGGATGEAEIELDAADRSKQELEVEVAGLKASAEYQVLIDGQLAGTLNTDARGRGNVELSRGTNSH